MANRSQSSSNLIILLLLIITFPIWIGILTGVFGIGMGIFGAITGIFAAIFGVLITLVMLPFNILFGWNGWCGDDDFSLFHHNGLAMVAFILLIALLLRTRNSK